jgi:hypothetical protein
MATEINSMSNWAPWKHEMAGLSVLYRLAIVKEEIPLLTTGTDFMFIEPLLDEMYRKGLIDQQGQLRWAMTEKGGAVIRTAIQMYDHLLKFEIFAKVDVARSLGPDEANPNSPNLVFDNLYDPRFGNPEDPEQPGNWEDLRLAVMAFLQETGGQGGAIEPHRIVFVQKLAAGKLWSPTFWVDLRLGTVFEEIEAIVETAIKWREVADTEEAASSAMRALYTAGMVEERKREGKECSSCGTPLAIYQAMANEAGQSLDACPNPSCGASFGPPPTGGGLECPRCHSALESTQRICSCGAHVDYSLPPGTITEDRVEETVEEVVPAWGTYYDPLFVPYGYYDPWAWTVGDAVAFGVVCAILW